MVTFKDLFKGTMGAVANAPSTMKKIDKGLQQTKEAARLYKKAQTPAVGLTSQEQKKLKANPVYNTLTTAQKIATEKKTPAFTTTTAEPAISKGAALEKSKYSTSDILAQLASKTAGAVLPRKLQQPTQDFAQSGFRNIQDFLVKKKGYTQAEERQKMKMKLLKENGPSFVNMDDKYLDYELGRLSSKERKSLQSEILDEKQSKYDKQVEWEKQHPIGPMEAFYERSQKPLQGAKGELAERALKGVLSGTPRGVLSGLSVGTFDVLQNLLPDLPGSELYRERLDQPERYIPPEQEVALAQDRLIAEYAPQVAQVMGQFIGGAATYGAIANKIEQGLNATVAAEGSFLNKHPVFTAYVAQNALEEVTEAGIRKTTGQSYGFNDFLWGMGLGGAFTSLGIPKKMRIEAMKKVETNLKKAEAIKGEKLTNREFQNVVLKTPFGKGKTMENFFNEAKLAYYHGKKEGIPGIDRPAPITDAKVEAENIIKQRTKDIKLAKKKDLSPSKVGESLEKASTWVKTQLVDETAPIQVILEKMQKKYGFEILPERNFYDQVDRVLRVDTVAEDFMRNNGLEKIIQEAPNLNNLRQYVLAKNNIALSKVGDKARTASLADDMKIVNAFENEGNYSALGDRLVQYSDSLLALAQKEGILSKGDVLRMKKANPYYVPAERIIEEVGRVREGKGTLASLTQQKGFKKAKGGDGEAPIEDPFVSLMGKTYDVIKDIERNKAAQMLASYKDLPGMDKYIRDLKPGEKVGAENKISYLKDGKKKEVWADKDFVEVAKNLGPMQTGLLYNIMVAPVRGFKAFTTGIAVPFAATNTMADLFTGLVQSGKMISGKDFVTGLAQAVGHGNLYKEVKSQAGLGTQFDITRGARPKTVKEIRARRNLGTRAVHTVTNPGQMWRALEDTIGRSEEVNRIAIYKSTKRDMMRKGMSEERAKIVAAREARDATSNFLRGGRFKKTIGALYPYMAAGFAGGRSFVRAMKRRPVLTSLKLAGTVMLPEAIITAWNTSDPERKEIYESIRPYEKEGNFIIVLPGAKINEKNEVEGVIKLKKNPGFKAIATPIRKEVERLAGVGEGVDVGDMIDMLWSPVAGMDENPLTDPQRFGESLLPHMAKTPAELMANKNFFTDKEIIPDYMRDLPPNEQKYPWTSGTAVQLGTLLNVSPLYVEHTMKGYGSSAGQHLLNAIDQGQIKLGTLPEEYDESGRLLNVGGKNIIEDLLSRVSRASAMTEGRPKKVTKIPTFKDGAPKFTNTYKPVTEVPMEGGKPKFT